MSILETEVKCMLHTKVCEVCAGEVSAGPGVGLSSPLTYFYTCKDCGYDFSSTDKPNSIAFVKPDGTSITF